MLRQARLLFAAFAAMMFLGSGSAALAQAAPTTAAAVDQPTVPEYILGSGDKVRVITFGEEQLTGEFFVGGEGRVALPLIGEIKAGGLTVRQFQTNIETALKDGYIKEPRVSVEVLNYRPFYILGEVKSPGTYPYTSGLTVLNAVATAEGFSYRADTKKVHIKRANETEERTYPLTQSTPVAPGDTIRIGERFF
ncbi:polysaccharide export protein [Caulobacter segnis]|uniref:polysaccharide biosynthesis/export family protein n=1 Tax=Caulobacter segnis TaxID=88688 RepID=UPI0024106E86|nr:polysaccharide biosynthesis/export family protein [Caulobacter segnis]MDG2520487.1 polysaccharide export protein [Caulobacter segnis]